MAIKSVCSFLILAVVLAAGCSRQQSDWEKTRAANTTDAYELFLKKYPSGEFSAQAQARVKGLYEERDWQKARDTDSAEAYQAFLKEYPEGKYTDEARIRVENFTLAAAPPNTTAAPDGTTPTAPASAAPTPPAVAPATPPPHAPLPAPLAKAKPAAASPSGSAAIQLGAYRASAGAANKRWAELEKKFPKYLGGLTPTVSAKKNSDGTIYRLQVVKLSEKQAREICTALKAKGQACVVLPAGG
jgi:SPOR domain